MIRSYQVEQILNTTDGATADISFGLKAKEVPLKIAHEIEAEFQKFLGRVTGGSVTMTKTGTRSIEWTKEELAAIRPAKTVMEARRLYRAEFPDSDRSKQAVKAKFTELKKAQAKPDISAGGSSPGPAEKARFLPKIDEKKLAEAVAGEMKKAVDNAKAGAGQNKQGKDRERKPLEKNFDAARWTEEERQIVRDAETREEAIATYQAKYPGARSDDAVGRQFYEMHPDKRSPITEWTEQEKAPILFADNVEEAIAEFRKLFPESERTEAAIRREWYELRPEKRGEVPTGRKKGSRNAAPLKGTAREKYQIPFSTKQNAKAYNHAVYICTKYDKPYAEAIKLEKADLEKKKREKESRAAMAPVTPEPPAKKPKAKKREHLPFRMKNAPEGKAPDPAPITTRYPSDENPHTAAAEDPLDPPLQHDDQPENYTVKGLDEDLANSLPDDRPPSGPKEQREARKISKGLAEGQKVRHNGSSSSPYYHKDGTIIDFDAKGQVLVDFGKGSSWLPPNILLPYPMTKTEAEA
jgi:hypothetical protein